MSIPANQPNRAAIGIELLTAWIDPDGTALIQNSLSKIVAENGVPGLVEATMGLHDVAVLLLIMHREATGKTMPAIIQDLAGKIQSSK